ncbi:MAG: pyridoxal-phosphate dependent enzyme, partial [Candidatus Thorarchaeota archaeon]
DQFNLEGNPNAWHLQAAREIIQQTGGKFDAFCDFVGSGGTLSGLTKAFKEYKPSIKCYAIEPSVAAVIAGKEMKKGGDHKIQGGGYSQTDLKFLSNISLDGTLEVTDDEAYETTRRLAREEGLFTGPSSGANVHGALQLLQGPMKDRTIVVVLCDSGLKYLTTDLW